MSHNHDHHHQQHHDHSHGNEHGDGPPSDCHHLESIYRDPALIEGLKPGETVVDLGSGIGIDCFSAAGKVGPSGQVIGVDVSSSMLNISRQKAEENGTSQIVQFRLGEIEHLPVADGIVDVIISNAVINKTDKAQVFREAARVLKSGGRIAISDVVEGKKMTQDIRDDFKRKGQCFGGASSVEELKEFVSAAGFTEVIINVHDDTWKKCAMKSMKLIHDDYINYASVHAVKK